MGHQALAFGRSSVRTLKSKRMLPLGTPKRSFSSVGQEVPVVRQLMCHDDYEIKNQRWHFLAECLVRGGSILKPIIPTILMRPEDIISCGCYEMGSMGIYFLRQTSGLVAANLMRGLNVSKLMKMENLLWSPERRCIMFNEHNLVGDTDDAACPYRAIYDTFDSAVELTTGYTLKKLPHALPWYLVNYLEYLLDASYTDKRLITNHSVTRFPSEHIQRNMTMNHVLWRKIPYEYGTPGWRCVRQVLAELGEIFPEELLTPAGLQPAIDYWAHHARENRGDFSLFPDDACPVILPLSPEGNKLEGHRRNIALGRILVALLRDPFEHPYDPAYNMVEPIWRSPYDLLHIDSLLNSFIPRFGPKAEACFLIWGLWDYLVDSKNQPTYCN